MSAGVVDLQLPVTIPLHALEQFCQKRNLRKMELFGSVLRDDFGPESDVDVLVTFDSERRPTLFEFIEMQDELKELFGREVDLLTRHSVEESLNPYRRRSILDSAKAIYAK